MNYFCPVHFAVSQLSGPLNYSGAVQLTGQMEIVSVASLTFNVEPQQHFEGELNLICGA